MEERRQGERRQGERRQGERRQARIDELVARLAARLRRACGDTPAHDFAAMVFEIAQMKLRFEQIDVRSRHDVPTSGRAATPAEGRRDGCWARRMRRCLTPYHSRARDRCRRVIEHDPNTEGTMRRLVLAYCCAAVLGGCGKSKNQTVADTADTAAAAAATPAAPAAISLAEVAGKWNMRTMNEAGDSTLVTYVLDATADPAGWTFAFKNRPPIPMRLQVSGDSIITDAGPYASALRKGVQVTTHMVSRLRDGKLVGTLEAHYRTSGPDSVRHLRSEGTRAQ